MATHEISILGPMTAPDSSGDIFFEPIDIAITLTTGAMKNRICTMKAPTGSDIGIYGKFNIPQNYAGTPVLVIRGVIAEAASVLGFGLQSIQRSNSETMEVAFDAEDLANNSVWTGLVAEDLYEETITITPSAAFVAGDEVFYFFFRDDTVDTQTGEFHLTGLFLRYSDT